MIDTIFKNFNNLFDIKIEKRDDFDSIINREIISIQNIFFDVAIDIAINITNNIIVNKLLMIDFE